MSETKNNTKLTEEHKKKISESRKGMKFTEAHKRNMRRAKRIRSTLTIRTPYGDYPSFNEAGRETGISYKTVFNRCNNPNLKWKDWQVIRREPEETEKSREERWSSYVKRKTDAHQKKLEDMSNSLQEFNEAGVREAREWRLQRLSQMAKGKD